jgi:hypothetical protein
MRRAFRCYDDGAESSVVARSARIECRPAPSPGATVVAALRDACAPSIITPPTDLLVAFAAVPNPRRAQKRHLPLPAILALAVA